MFNSVQFVRDLCKERKVTISRLEKDLQFGNGYLNPKKLQKLPYDRALQIADYLKVPVELILTGETGGEKRPITDEELKFALWGSSEEVTDEDLADVLRYAAFVRERKKESK